ncbi:MAG: DUF1588 domain-containing protein, partial [Verrucomicrobiales bacterium]|nr:DUF1588 domain-containing protein [Verrucomicrobiales bacterium]
MSLISHLLPLVFAAAIGAPGAHAESPNALLENYCFDCHDEDLKKGNLDMTSLMDAGSFDGTLMFENLITAKMPPADKTQPSDTERSALLGWLAKQQAENTPNSFRRISRHEFVHAINDLLGTDLDLAHQIPEDRGTNDFDSDRRIQLSREMLGAYFAVADEMLEFAFPQAGIPDERVWVTDKLKDSHETYNIYLRPYRDGTLFSWTRANNGNSYSFFYDNFDPPVSGWYDLTFDAAKVGDFDEHVSLQVYAGKYYYADDRPQPQRLLDVISLGDRQLGSHTIRVFLNPGENVSVHCYSKHNFRQKGGNQGAYIEQLEARGPVFDQWPPPSYQTVFAGLPTSAPPRRSTAIRDSQTNLQRIGGHLSVSSFQDGMEKEKMQDGSNRTFWHTRFKPTVATPPHEVVLENPNAAQIDGLSYATWSGGNGNGQVKAYEIYFSDNGESWGDPVASGELEVRLANEQPIVFSTPSTTRFIKFLVTDSVQLDGKSLASIGKLDVLTPLKNELPRTTVSVSNSSSENLKTVVRRFAEKAFSSPLGEEQLAPYLAACLADFEEHGDFVQATKIGLKTILCSPRFLMAPGEHANASYAKAATLARVLWLSVPDDELLQLSSSDALSGKNLRTQIDRMLADPRSQRMVHSFTAQWLNLRSFKKVTPSLKLYPLYDDLLDLYLPIETNAYLHHLIQHDLPVTTLIDSDFAFLNQRLAQHYGITGILGQKLRKVSIPPDVPRGGLLTMGSVLKVTTDGYDTSPILRGAWISKNIVGTPLSPPPENVQAIEPDHGEEAATLREQIEQHKSNKTCYACHKSIDPYGFALENFDATGQWRSQYQVKLPHRGTFQYRPQGYYRLGGEVDAAGEIGQEKFADIHGLQKLLLSDHRKIAYNFAKQFFEYANGYEPDLTQRLDLHGLIEGNPEKCRMKDLLAKLLV